MSEHDERNLKLYYRILPFVGLCVSAVLMVIVKVVNNKVEIIGYLYCLLPFIVYTTLAILHRTFHRKKRG